MAEKHGVKKLVDKVLHPKSQAQGSGEASPAVPKASKPRKAGSVDPVEDFKQHPKFAKFKGRA